MAHGSEDKPFLVGEGILLAVRWTHAVNPAAVVFTQERTRLLAELPVAVLVRYQVGFGKSVRCHVQMLGDPFGIGIRDLDVEGLAAVGTAGAIDDLEGPVVQFTSQFVGFETVVPELQAAQELVILVVVQFGIPPPVFNHRVVIHVVFLKQRQETA